MAQKIRIFKLAQEFELDSTELVKKVQEMGLEARNYMSALSEEDAQLVRDGLSSAREENTIEEMIRPTVVRRRMKDGAPTKPAKKKPVKEAKEIKEVKEPKKTKKVKEVETKEPLTAPQEKEAEPLAARPEELAARDETVRVAAEEQEAAVAEPVAAAQKSRADVAEPIGRPAVLRPASEAPVVRRVARTVKPDQAPTPPPFQDVPQSESGTPQSEHRKGKSFQRRREVESREMASHGQFTGIGPGKFGAQTLGRKRRMAPGKKGKKTEITTPKASKRIIRIEEQISLQELAKRMSVKSTDLLMHLIGLGVGGVNINSTLDADTAKVVASEFGYEVEDIAIAEEELLVSTRGTETETEKADREPRPPVVTLMGHVDHGKTSLLDSIGKTNLTSKEAGGITQHIGAHRVKTSGGTITFIDTPGHEAFTAMRARGANVTDIVILVVAADDGVMPQTIEAVKHAQAADVPIIVAMNKCDLPTANPKRTKQMLMERGLVPEDLGGTTIFCEVSAKTGAGVDKLLEMILLQGEVMELTANSKRMGMGIVLDAYIDKGRGPVASVIVKDGTLRTGDVLVVGRAYGKIRALTDEQGRKVKEASPSTPVEVLGLPSVPKAGDLFDVVEDMKIAEKVASSRTDRQRATAGGAAPPSLDSIYQQMQDGEQLDLKIIIKADVQGSAEALSEALHKLSTEKVTVTIVHSSVGGITESDVLLASTSGAIIVGFNSRPAGKARSLADEQNVDIRLFTVVYDAIEDVKKAMVGLLKPTIKEEILGHLEVRDTFSIPKFGTIAGSYVVEGKVVRNAQVRLIRDSIQIWEGRVGSLRRFKDDVKEVTSGFECGISLAGYNDIKVNDVIEVFTHKEIEATLA